MPVSLRELGSPPPPPILRRFVLRRRAVAKLIPAPQDANLAARASF
jgi:hypothetical protein